MAGAPAIAIIGTGFGGIGMAARLLRAGFDHLTVFEKADRIGGVWAANSYPGAACDIPAALYSFSFAPKPDWSRRVPVVGTGASAIQFVPPVVRQAAHTTLFQRAAPHVIPKPDRRCGPGLRSAFRRLPGLLALDRAATYARLEWRALGFTRRPELLRVADRMNQRLLTAQVRDPELRRVLTPQGPPGCKRILLSDDYYAALDSPDVDVVTSPIARILPTGVLTADGVEHPADTIIWGTGFTATDFLTPMAVSGAGGRNLREAWRDGAEAYLGISVAGFPNLFLRYGPNTNPGHNSIVFMLESRFRYILGAVRRIAATGMPLAVHPEVQRHFADRVQDRIARTVWALGCSSWYRTASGRNTTNWPDFTVAYRVRTRRFDPSKYTTPVFRTARFSDAPTDSTAPSALTLRAVLEPSRVGEGHAPRPGGTHREQRDT